MGPFYGAMTFQGIVPYIYEEHDPSVYPSVEGDEDGIRREVDKRGMGREINRCVWNNMMDNPMTKDGGECRGPVKGVKVCEDCRMAKMEDIGSFHFTLCQKPWNCYLTGPKKWCEGPHRKWFEYRREMEEERGVYKGEGMYMEGFCRKQGKQGYIPINHE